MEDLSYEPDYFIHFPDDSEATATLAGELKEQLKALERQVLFGSHEKVHVTFTRTLYQTGTRILRYIKPYDRKALLLPRKFARDSGGSR